MACEADATFGPSLGTTNPACRDFDFTLTFQYAIFQILPGVVFAPLALSRARALLSKAIIYPDSLKLSVKTILFTVLSLVQLAEVILSATSAEDMNQGSEGLAIGAKCAALITTLCLAVTSYVEHGRTPGPSLVVQIALSMSLLLDAVLLRTSWTIWMAPDHGSRAVALAAVQTSSAALKLAALICESETKVLPQDGDHRPNVSTAEERSGFFGRTFMFWLNPLFSLGYKSHLTINDLQAIDLDLSGEAVTKQLQLTWARTPNSQRGRLAVALASAFKFTLVLVHVPRLGLVACSIVQPLLIRAILSYMQEQDDLPWYYGYCLIAATALTYLLLTIMTLWSQHLTFRFLTMVRGALIGMIFQSALAVHASEGRSGAQPVTLMSTEIDRISHTLQWSLAIAPNVVQVGLGLWILSSYIEIAVIAPALVAIVCGLAAAGISKKIPKRQAKWMKSIQDRVSMTSNILAQIIAVRMSGLQSAANQNLLQTRDNEIQQQKSFRKLQIANIVVGNIPAMLSPALTFAAFAIIQAISVESDATFDVVLAFTSLSLLSILIAPIAELVAASINITSALTCLNRIQQFLGQNEPGESATTQSMDGCIADESLVRMQACSFRWTKGVNEPVLIDMSLDITPGSVTLVTGPVGCGKSMLLLSVLGESYVATGQITRTSPSKISYSAQEPWIPNLTLREVIIGSSDDNGARYAEVVAVCQLAEDFARMPEGDRTFAGSGGSRLSGGQRQRLSLARAIYSPKRLVLLDDSFSALDKNTAKKVAESLLGKNGFLRREQRAVLWASQNTSWASYADEVITLRQGRMFSESPRKTCRSTITAQTDTQHETTSTSGHRDDCPAASQQRQAPKTSGLSKATNVTDAPHTRRQADLNTDVEPRKSSLAYYMSLIGNIRLVAFIAMIALLVGCSVGQTLWLKFWATQSSGSDRPLGVRVGIYGLLATLNIVAIGMETSFFFLKIVPHVGRKFHASMVPILSAHMDFFSRKDTGEVLNLFAGDLNLIDLPLPLSFLLTCEKLASTIAEAALTCLSSGYLAASIPFVGMAVYLVQRVYLRTSRQLRVLDLEAKVPLLTHFSECYEGRVTIRAMAWNTPMVERNMGILDASQKPHYLLYCLQRWLNLVLDLITTALATLLVGVAVSQRESIDVGYLGVGLVSVMGFGQTLSQLITHWTNLETSLGAVDRVRKYVASTPPEPVALSDDDPEEADQPVRGAVEFHGVSASRCGHQVLRNICLYFKPGTKTAICGRTGCGKSTFLDALLRLMDLDHGTITLDGRDIAQIQIDTVRELVVAMPQDALLLTGRTIRQNLDPYDHHHGAESGVLMLEVLEEVGLAEVVHAHGGLDVEIEPTWFSGGERQLFGLARVLLRRGTGRVLLLDEATSSLDPNTTNKIYQLIDKHFHAWTVIVVTHQVDDVVRHAFDQVVVMDGGTVAEIGHPSALMSTEEE